MIEDDKHEEMENDRLRNCLVSSTFLLVYSSRSNDGSNHSTVRNKLSNYERPAELIINATVTAGNSGWRPTTQIKLMQLCAVKL